jgi:phasin
LVIFVALRADYVATQKEVFYIPVHRDFAETPFPGLKIMNDQFARQAQEMFNVAKDARIPENFQAFAEDSVSKTREVFSKFNSAAQDNVKAFEEVVLTSHAGAKSIGEKVLTNTAANTEAAFDAAQAISRAKTLPEAARLQADFMQQQMAAVTNQTKELFELSTKVAKQTFDTFNQAATKSMDKFKNAN